MTTLTSGDIEADDLMVEVRRFVVAEGIGGPDARAALRWLVPWAAGWTVLASALVSVHPLALRLPLLAATSFWLVGAGALIHVLLVIAVVLFLVNLISGRRTAI